MSIATATAKHHLRARLQRFMPRPQRHRLLHGYRLALLVEAGLLTECQHAYSVTPRGMFFSDSIAGLLAEGRLPRRRRHGVYNDNSQGFM